eukprot:6201150-Pleurochrysis_carterae.AAC.1
MHGSPRPRHGTLDDLRAGSAYNFYTWSEQLCDFIEQARDGLATASPRPLPGALHKRSTGAPCMGQSYPTHQTYLPNPPT